ncbi:MAG: hypothetical protein MRY83_01235 [Flavobacteriales bacterium]|nr:hypothetical protein [Flavobacteriales bacterium]
MNLIERDISKDLEAFEVLGSVLEVCSFSFDQLDMVDLRQAAIRSMEVFQQRYVERWERLNPDLNIDEYFNIKIDRSKSPQFKEISLQDFIGHGYSLKKNELALYNYAPGVVSGACSEGLVYALLSPPYSLRLNLGKQVFGSAEHASIEKDLMSRILLDFLKVLGLELKVESSIKFYEWSVDWSNYFDAGKEWWGAFYWSVLDKKNKQLTFIAASATD